MTNMPPSPELPLSNVPEFTVTSLSSALKQTVEERFNFVRVRGEISGYRGPHSSGHAYFTLKDANARLDAVIWKGVFGKMRTKPQEGLEVVATGKLTTFPGKSNYQIVIESLEPAGVGALMALLEERRIRLQAEGLFDLARKRALPYLPTSIGVITSPTGAVIRDILHRLNHRFPRPVLLWPVRVQGETCAEEVAAAIDGMNALPLDGPLPRPSVLIVARGGGSIEDLWGFNDEALVRAAAQSQIPIISAIGHETDWSLLDHVADIRAPTPTAAAELSVPVKADLQLQVSTLAHRHTSAHTRYIERQRVELRNFARALPKGQDLLNTPSQRLDQSAERLRAILNRQLQSRLIQLTRVSGLLARHSPHAELARRQERLKALAPRLIRAYSEALKKRQTQLENMNKLLTSLSYQRILGRGFALLRDEEHKPLLRAADTIQHQHIQIELMDGVVHAQVMKGTTQKGKQPPTPSKITKQNDAQGSLF